MTKWTKERCHEEALKYKSRNDFRRGNGSTWAYRISLKNNWMNDICSHMSIVGNMYKRCIYAFEFADNSVYVGLTYNLNKRSESHFKSLQSQVNRHISRTGLQPNIVKLTDYIDVNVAKIKEGEFIEFYRNNNWFILNIQKSGGVGGKLKHTREECFDVVNKYKKLYDFRKKELNIYKTIIRYNWDDLLLLLGRDLKEHGYWTKEKCQEVALKYNNRIDFFKLDVSAYNKSQKNGWLDDVCSHMNGVKYKNKGYWTKELCLEESKKYKTKQEFKNGSPSAYVYCIKNKWMNETSLCGNKKWTKEMCLDIIKSCNSKYEIKKINLVVYRIFRENRWNIQSEIYWL